MKRLSLDSILLFTLIVPFIMTVRIGPGETPFWLFGLIFLGTLLYMTLDLVNIAQKKQFIYKVVLFWLLFCATIGSAFFSTIVVRHQTAPIYGVHDIILQQESALRYLIHGKNPYKETYFGTPLEEWHYSDTEVNPALYHFVMQPLYLLFVIPFYLMSSVLFGFFDARIPLLFLYVVSIVTLFIVVKDKEKKLLSMILFAFNPAMLLYTLEGRSDVFMFAFLLIGFLFLYKKNFLLSGIFIAFAFAVKQSAWPLLPFYFLYIYYQSKDIQNTVKNLLPFIVTISAFIVPFLLWDAKAYIDSTILYLSGSGAHSYPISGYGLGMILSQAKLITNSHAYYPFIYWQIAICVPLLIFLSVYLKRSITVARLILVYGIFLFVYWYTSRYFNNSHLGYLSMVFITAYFWPVEKK